MGGPATGSSRAPAYAGRCSKLRRSAGAEGVVIHSERGNTKNLRAKVFLTSSRHNRGPNDVKANPKP
jgi:hypothetical protein